MCRLVGPRERARGPRVRLLGGRTLGFSGSRIRDCHRGVWRGSNSGHRCGLVAEGGFEWSRAPHCRSESEVGQYHAGCSEEIASSAAVEIQIEARNPLYEAAPNLDLWVTPLQRENGEPHHEIYGGIHPSVEVHELHTDGSVSDLVKSRAPFPDAGGKVIGLVTIQGTQRGWGVA